MGKELLLLIMEALSVYLLVLGTHALRGRYGLSFFYALMGSLTAIMSWVTDAGVCVQAGPVTFMVGSTVFYTSLLLGVFVVYVFDGPRATRIAISTVAGVSAMVPLIALALQVQMQISGHPMSSYVPTPSLRINLASVLATVADLLFLGIAWEFFGKPRLGLHLWVRAFLTLLGVMWLDVILFATGAFAGTPGYANIMVGTLTSRLAISLFACPLLYAYLFWQKENRGILFENRPVLTILKEVAEIRLELSLAQQEIERRKRAEAEKEAAIRKLEATLLHVQRLEGILPVCSGCKKIRVEPVPAGEPPRWLPLEEYLHQETPVQFSHGLCEECYNRLFAPHGEGH
jgi:uncharacterized PurR-regulated membrane protein YhhQ (DUF165 family)